MQSSLRLDILMMMTLKQRRKELPSKLSVEEQTDAGAIVSPVENALGKPLQDVQSCGK